jgi:large repetitive protein
VNPAGARRELGTTGALITDPVPAGLQFVASSDCTAAGATVSCDLGPVAPGQTKTAAITARVGTGTAGTTLINTARVASAASGDTPALPELDPSDNSDAAAVSVNPEADLSLSKSVANPDPPTDAEVNYTLTVKNAGPNDASNVKIVDSLPSGLEFIDASPGCDNTSRTITCTIDTLANGDASSVTIRARTTAAVAGASLGNLASVSAAEGDATPANNNAGATINVQPLVDLDLTKAASNPAPASGGPVSFTLTLVNKGPSPATAAEIVDPLPSGLAFRAAAASQGTCGAAGQLVTCELGTLAPGATAIMTVTVDVAGGTSGTALTNTATASANEPVARPGLLSADATVRPTAPKPDRRRPPICRSRRP